MENELTTELFAATREGFSITFTEDYRGDSRPSPITIQATYVQPNAIGERPIWTEYAEDEDDLAEVVSWLIHDAKADLKEAQR